MKEISDRTSSKLSLSEAATAYWRVSAIWNNHSTEKMTVSEALHLLRKVISATQSSLCPLLFAARKLNNDIIRNQADPLHEEKELHNGK